VREEVEGLWWGALVAVEVRLYAFRIEAVSVTKLMTFVPGRGGFQQSYGPPASVLGMRSHPLPQYLVADRRLQKWGHSSTPAKVRLFASQSTQRYLTSMRRYTWKIR
jgi:hypothetical protein